jgi:hypothetical protein
VARLNGFAHDQARDFRDMTGGHQLDMGINEGLGRFIPL